VNAYTQRGSERTIVIASGGRRWGDFVEADVMARELTRRGVPEGATVRERCSLTTRDNARFAAAMLARRGIGRAVVVTSDWHLDRAVALFRQTGLLVEGVPAHHPAAWATRLRRRATERLLIWLQAALGMCWWVGCSKGAPAAPVQPDAAAASPAIFRSIERAEDQRRAREIPELSLRNRDRAIRRRAVRALARILDSDDTPLLRALEDDDEDTVAWAGYGLGESCRGREESHVRALAARLASLDDGTGRLAPHARSVIVRALGRCGGDRAEQTLRGCLERREAAASPEAGVAEFDEAVAYALGDSAAQRGSLSLDSAAALVDAALSTPPLDAALYPFGRVDGTEGEELEPRLYAAARAALERPGPARIFAVRAMGRTNPRKGATELARVLASDGFTPAERAEAARTLGRLRDPGQQALATALASILPRASPTASDGFGVLLAAVMALGDRAPDGAPESLKTVTRIAPPPGSLAAVARRISALRCAASERLARDAWDSSVIRNCDVADGEAGERARLAALDRGQLVKARRAAWLELVRDTKHVRVRERAIDSIAHHPELGDAARVVLAEALGASAPGVVATAANVVRAHPDRVYVLAERERRDALDPNAPPPQPNPARELDSRVAAALRTAMARPWTEDLVETRIALVDAALSVGLEEAHAFALAACHDVNAALRARASTALASAGVVTTCAPPEVASAPAAEIDGPISRPTRVVFDTDAGALGIVFDPALAPIAATRFVALARSGFYTGMTIHRVVPGFVVQLGDPGGDGYGGSGKLLRCETSPVPFHALDVGVALAGRDTGSSQLFVALARYPHLDGQYTWVGRGDGDWNAVTEGDLVHRVRLEE
jgi:cyclophilin family peptidyl-prolyl cis-trans isomerase